MQASLQAASQRDYRKEVSQVYSYLASQAAKDRQREMLAQARRDASPGQPAAPGTTGPCAGQGISACRTGPAAGPRGGAQGSALRAEPRAMTPLPAGHARPHRVPDQAHPGSSPAPRERAPPPDHGGGAPCRAERLRRPMVRRRSAGSGRRLTIRRRQHTHPAHRAVAQNGGSACVIQSLCCPAVRR